MTNPTPRIALSVPQEIKTIYENTAKAAGMPTSKLIVQIMIESAPAVFALGEALQKAKQDPLKALTGLSEILQEVDKSSAEFQLDIEDQIKNQSKK